MDGSAEEAAAGTLGLPADQQPPGTAPPPPGRQQAEESSDGSSSSSESSSGSGSSSESEGDEEGPASNPMADPLSYLDLRRAFLTARQKKEAGVKELLGMAGPKLPPALSGPAWERPSPEEYELILNFCVEFHKLEEGVLRESTAPACRMGEAARRATVGSKITAVPLYEPFKTVMETAWATPNIGPGAVTEMSAAVVTSLLASFISRGVPPVEESFADFVQQGAADWERKTRVDGVPLPLQIQNPEKEELRAGLSKMVQLFAVVASNVSILASVVDTLQTELFRRLFDKHQGLSRRQQERMFLGLQFLLKLLKATAEAAGSGVGLGVYLTRILWLRHCKAMGRTLPDRAVQTLRESAVDPSGLLGQGWKETVERQSRLLDERENLQALARASRTSHSASSERAPPAKFRKESSGAKHRSKSQKGAQAKPKNVNGSERRRRKKAAAAKQLSSGAASDQGATSSAGQAGNATPQGASSSAQATGERRGGKGRVKARHHHTL